MPAPPVNYLKFYPCEVKLWKIEVLDRGEGSLLGFCIFLVDGLKCNRKWIEILFVSWLNKNAR